MAFKMNGFSGFKDTSDTVEYATEKGIKKGVGDQIGKNLIKRGFKNVAKTIPIVSAATLGADAYNVLQEEEVGQKAVENLKNPDSSKRIFLGKI